MKTPFTDRYDFLVKQLAEIENKRRNTMKSGIRDEAEGTFHQVKGKIKEIAGQLIDNPELEAEGTVEKMAGKVQEKIGEVKKVWEK